MVQSIVRYIKSKPRNIQFAPPNGEVNPDFRLFINQWVDRDPSTISTDHLGSDVSENHRHLYAKYMSLLFHKVYSLFSESSFGSANYHIMHIFRDGGTYILRFWGIQPGYKEYRISDAKISFNGERMTLASNNGFILHIVRTREPFDANSWADPDNPDIHDTYKLSLYHYGDIKERVYTVALHLPQ